MFKIVRTSPVALMSVSAISLWCHQAPAGQMIQDVLTCDINNPKSTIESCDTLIKGYKEALIVTELDIRSKIASDPDRSREMLYYSDLQIKLKKCILNREKIKLRENDPNPAEVTKKSSFRWPNSDFRRVSPYDTTTFVRSNSNWSGTGAAIQTTFGVGNIYRVTGTSHHPSV